MSLEACDVDLMLAEVGRFAHGPLAAEVTRPEAPVDGPVLNQLREGAVALGLLGAAGEVAEFGLWPADDSGSASVFSIRALQLLGEVNAGIALAWHRAALAAHLAGGLGLDRRAGGAAVAVTGHYGLARSSLARWLLDRKPEQDDTALLSDWLDRHARDTFALAPVDWQWLLWPVWTAHGPVWCRHARDKLIAERQRPQHGLDELVLWRLRLPEPVPAAPRQEAARAMFGRALKMEVVAALAIASGAVRGACRMTLDYAARRRQGGVPINRYPAVQSQLAIIDSALVQADDALGALDRPLDAIDLGRLLTVRARLDAALREAANAAMQVHGGIGYMRDIGIEKRLREVNMLSTVAGGVREIPLFLAEWQS